MLIKLLSFRGIQLADNLGLLGILLVALLVMFVFVIFLFFKQRNAEKKATLVAAALRTEIQAMSSTTIGMGKRIVDVESKLELSLEKQFELEQRDPDEVVYSQAARLVEMGANVDDLVQSCGIGRPEAELMALMHKELNPKKSLQKR